MAPPRSLAVLSTLVVLAALAALTTWLAATQSSERSRPNLAFSIASPTATVAAPPPAPPTGRLAFSAGGSIYTVNADGTDLRQIVLGSRLSGPVTPPDGAGIAAFSREGWSSAPAYSPDGSRLAFIRDYDVWVAGAQGEDAHLLAAVSDIQPSPGASNNSLGASSANWSPDGSRLAVVTMRIGGSGITKVLVMEASGQDWRQLLDDSAFLVATWSRDGKVIAWEEPNQVDVIDPGSGARTRLGLDLRQVRHPVIVTALAGGSWLAGPFIEDGPILLLEGQRSRQIATGVSPAASPDGQWVAYYAGDAIRIVAADGAADHLLLDTGPLGGRDYHFATTPACYPQRSPACSYRPPVTSWTR